MRLATGPVTWGVDFADAPSNPPWELVLDEIAASPVDALELGPVGYLPEDPRQLREALDSRSLLAVGSFIFDDLHDQARQRQVLAVAERASRAIAAAGGRVLVIIDRPSPQRVATAGRGADAERLSTAGWEQLMETIAAVAEVARGHGLRGAVHPHAGGYLEFEDELERLLSETDFELCIDTGHLAYAGADPAAALRRAGDRVAHVHLKDIDALVLDQVRAERLDFWTAIERRIFCPLGAGIVDLDDVRRALEEIGYEGYVTIEQDRVPGSGSPLEDLAASVAVLGELPRGAVSE